MVGEDIWWDTIGIYSVLIFILCDGAVIWVCISCVRFL
jgi:hypothetical protein